MRVFMTGATGYIGSRIAKLLAEAGYQVTGLVRTGQAAAMLEAAGIQPLPGGLDDLDVLARSAADSDGVVHTAFIHDFTRRAQASATDRAAIEAMAYALAGSGRPLVIASGIAGVHPSTMLTEDDPGQSGPTADPRLATEQALVGLASTGVRTVAVRLSPTVHGPGDQGFIARLIQAARDNRAAIMVGDGTNRWPAVHVDDAARLFVLALESAPAGSRLHAAAEDGIPFRDIATLIARRLDVPLVALTPDEAITRLGWLGGIASLDTPASNHATQTLTGWTPVGPGLLEDMADGDYFNKG